MKVLLDIPMSDLSINITGVMATIALIIIFRALNKLSKDKNNQAHD